MSLIKECLNLEIQSLTRDYILKSNNKYFVYWWQLIICSVISFATLCTVCIELPHFALETLKSFVCVIFLNLSAIFTKAGSPRSTYEISFTSRENKQIIWLKYHWRGGKQCRPWSDGLHRLLRYSACPIISHHDDNISSGMIGIKQHVRHRKFS